MRLATPADTEAVGRCLAERMRPGDVVALTGDLGAGKTTLVRGLLRALGHAGDVPSPSFAIVQPYESAELRLPIVHADLYRLDARADVMELGLEEYLADGALAVEWPALLPKTMLAGALAIDLRRADSDARVLTATVPPGWEGRWPPR